MSSIWVTTLWMYGLAIAVSMGVAVIIKLIVLALGVPYDEAERYGLRSSDYAQDY